MIMKSFYELKYNEFYINVKYIGLLTLYFSLIRQDDKVYSTFDCDNDTANEFCEKYII